MESNQNWVKSEIKTEEESESTLPSKPESDCEFSTFEATHKEETR
jgi:hypothetical protein